MMIKLPGADNAFVNPDHIVAITPYSNATWPDRKSLVAFSNSGVMYSILEPSDLYNQISEAIYNRNKEH